MEKNELKPITAEEPKINYRGVRAMPFVIGKKKRYDHAVFSAA